MIRLVDTSVWIDHLARGDAELVMLLEAGEVVMHPFVRAEIALGSLRERKRLLAEFDRLPPAPLATHEEVLVAIEAHRLYGSGLGYVDAHLIASTLLTSGARLLTRDRRLAGAAARLGIA